MIQQFYKPLFTPVDVFFSLLKASKRAYLGMAASHRSSFPLYPCPRRPARQTPAPGCRNAFDVFLGQRRTTDYSPTTHSTRSIVHAGCSWSQQDQHLRSLLHRLPVPDCHNPAADTCNNRRQTRRACRG